ncbi:MAG TPA: hypothetical protein VII71_04230, partial [Verrucomicrobiae bacterium]
MAARRIYLHSSFAKSGGFLFLKIFRPRAGLSIVKTVRGKNHFPRAKLKDQQNEKKTVVRAGIGRR